MSRLILLFCVMFCSPLTMAAEVLIAVAANFALPAKRLAAQFEQETGHKVKLANGATGGLYAQIVNGAPFDIFLSADDATPARLEREGLAVSGTRFTYAVGRLVLWSATPGMVDENGTVLHQRSLTHLAIASPRVAPYGRAAVEVMRALGVYAKLEARLVQGENIVQAHQFVLSGAAPLGFVAMSQVVEDGKLKSGSAWFVPQSLYAPIRQDAVLLKRAQEQPAAREFLRHLQSEKARSLILTNGYALP